MEATHPEGNNKYAQLISQFVWRFVTKNLPQPECQWTQHTRRRNHVCVQTVLTMFVLKD